jgi:hypothetical protein
MRSPCSTPARWSTTTVSVGEAARGVEGEDVARPERIAEARGRTPGEVVAEPLCDAELRESSELPAFLVNG